VFLSPDRRGDRVEADAKALLAQLARAGADADIETLGDSIMLPSDFELAPLAIASRMFGNEFAASLADIEPGQWTGPIASGYGLHVVYVRERVAGREPALDDVRDAVTRDLLTSRRKEQLESMYERLLEKYTVVIDMPEPETAPAAGAPESSAGEAR
jgi:hypothetical protein